MVGSVVITHYNGQPAAMQFKQRLERDGIKTYCHYLIEGYPHNVKLIASDEGFGKTISWKRNAPSSSSQRRALEAARWPYA